MTDTRVIIRAALILTVACLLAGSAAASPFRTVVNEPFASVCNGPMGAIAIEDDGIQTTAAGRVKSAVASQHSVSGLQRAERTVRRMIAHRLKSHNAHIAFPRRVVHVSGGRIVAPDLMQATQVGAKLGEPTNELRFTFEGFTDVQKAQFAAYLDRALPKAYTIYGRPAFDLDVKVILDTDLHIIQGGVYDAARNEIRMANLSGTLAEDTFILMILTLYAFHDDAALFYDVWEEGFAGAAATAIQTTPGVMTGYNPIDPGPFYATSVYEPQNQRDLGGPTFYPTSGFRGMLAFRIAMARSVWFKTYIEDNDFFANFNRTYYDNFADGLAGDVPRLRTLASQVLPRVEGMPFQEWFQRQQILDTSERLGPKLFVWNAPLPQSVMLLAEHYFSLPGDEEPRGGQARTIYWAWDFAVSLFAEEGNIIDIPATGDSAGEGFLIPTFFNIGGPQTITRLERAAPDAPVSVRDTQLRVGPVLRLRRGPGRGHDQRGRRERPRQRDRRARRLDRPNHPGRPDSPPDRGDFHEPPGPGDHAPREHRLGLVRGLPARRRAGAA
jgi:hypothetical protein